MILLARAQARCIPSLLISSSRSSIQFQQARKFWKAKGTRNRTSSTIPVEAVGRASLRVQLQQGGQIMANTFSRLQQSKELAMGLAIVLGGAFAIDRVFNAETELLDGEVDFENTTERPSAALLKSNQFVRNYLKETYMMVGLGVFLTGTSAYALHLSPLFQSLMARNPVGVTVSSLMASGVISNATLITPPEYKNPKYGLFSLFAATKGIFLSSMLVMSPPLLGRLGLYSAGLIGSLSYIAANTKSDQYIWIGGPLLGILTVDVLRRNAKNILPSAMHAMPTLYATYLYGGLAVFGFFILRDMEKVARNAHIVQQGNGPPDTVNEAIRLYLDFMSILP
ncbi:inhibitor of apoptosis-promoting Bax1-domain-containing protein [Chytriomyces sp. MP71]|nr:inhibitor of apoptosis-promoting Bax1-domain-containing protein [Chytriomyces sp. MP71]